MKRPDHRHRAWLQEGETDLSLPNWMSKDHVICAAYQTRGEETAERRQGRKKPYPPSAWFTERSKVTS